MASLLAKVAQVVPVKIPLQLTDSLASPEQMAGMLCLLVGQLPLAGLALLLLAAVEAAVVVWVIDGKVLIITTVAVVVVAAAALMQGPAALAAL